MIYTLSFRLSRPVHSGRLFVGTHIPPVIPPYSAHNPAQPPPLSSRLPSSAPRSRPLPTPPPARQYERAGVGGRGGCGVCSYTPHWAVFRVACGRGPCGRVLVGCFRPLGASWGPPGGLLGAVGGLSWASPGALWLVPLVGLAWSPGVCTPVLLCGGTEFTWSSLFLVELGAAAAWSRR